MRRFALIALVALLGSGPACSSNEEGTEPAASSQAAFDLDADFADPTQFYRFPYPSDLRLRDGAPIGSAFPNPLGVQLVESVRNAASGRKGFPVVPTGYFKFGQPLAPRSIEEVIPADPSSPVLLVDVDDASPEKGRLIPTVAAVLAPDEYVPENVLGVAPRPGFVLHGKRKYAFVVLRSLKDARGALLEVPPTLARIAKGEAPAGARGGEALALHAPLFAVLKDKGIAAGDVAAATVFTTGDVVADFGAMSDGVVKAHSATIGALSVDPDDGATHPRYCELVGTMTLPQFQKGTPPFASEGLFEIGADGLPKKQRDETVPIRISLPKQAMPAGGYPLVMYFHGSGGLSTAPMDRGTWRPESDPSKCPEKSTDSWEGVKGCNTQGEGPSHVVAEHGFAMAGSALPVNPERVKNATSIEYIQLGNLAAMRDTFRQGALEQRLYLKALLDLQIAPDVVSACTGMSLPSGETAYRFKAEPIVAMGQSMGGMYTNIIGAIEPKIRAVAPTGAGGYWSYFITKTTLYSDGAQLVASLANAGDDLNWMHPILTTFETAVEPADPFVYMPRLARDPLEGHAPREIYEPVGKGDSYFPIELYDAVALSYGHPQAGEIVWPSMQDALKLGALDGLRSYPISQNLTSVGGKPYTGVVVQYAGDGVYDPHAIYTQLDAVKYQYGCFFASFLAKGVATVPAPAPLGTPCPGL